MEDYQDSTEKMYADFIKNKEKERKTGGIDALLGGEQ